MTTTSDSVVRNPHSEIEMPARPSLAYRAGSTFVVGIVGVIVRTFMYGLSRPQVHGLDKFLQLLDERADVENRERGLITVSNHLSIIDDPLMWGILPIKYLVSPDNMRWSLASHDICFKNSIASQALVLGQTLPTHRAAHSKFGGLFQPTMVQAIRLLSSQPFNQSPPVQQTASTPSDSDHDLMDPFTNGSFFYSTNHIDLFHSPTAYHSRRHAWVHIFPEGKIHQHKDKIMRYFKWGVSRLILESEPAPALVPMYIEGFDQVYHESRTWPRPMPRAGKDLVVTFGDMVETEEKFGDLRSRWRELVEKERATDPDVGRSMGVLTERLKYGDEARHLREECTLRVREEILKIRRGRGYVDEDPKCRLVDTWRSEGTGKREGQMADGSWVKDT